MCEAAELKLKADANLCQAHQLYKWDQNENVWSEPVFVARNYVFVEQLE